MRNDKLCPEGLYPPLSQQGVTRLPSSDTAAMIPLTGLVFQGRMAVMANIHAWRLGGRMALSALAVGAGVSKIRARRPYQGKACHYQASLAAGTVFYKTRQKDCRTKS